MPACAAQYQKSKCPFELQCRICHERVFCSRIRRGALRVQGFKLEKCSQDHAAKGVAEAKLCEWLRVHLLFACGPVRLCRPIVGISITSWQPHGGRGRFFPSELFRLMQEAYRGVDLGHLDMQGEARRIQHPALPAEGNKTFRACRWSRAY
jgi:hypothetical protein